MGKKKNKGRHKRKKAKKKGPKSAAQAAPPERMPRDTAPRESQKEGLIVVHYLDSAPQQLVLVAERPASVGVSQPAPVVIAPPSLSRGFSPGDSSELRMARAEECPRPLFGSTLNITRQWAVVCFMPALARARASGATTPRELARRIVDAEAPGHAMDNQKTRAHRPSVELYRRVLNAIKALGQPSEFGRDQPWLRELLGS